MMVMTTPQQTITQAFNGTAGWRKFNDKISPMSAADMVGARRDAIFLKDIELKPQYSKLTVVGKQQVEGHDTYLLEGTLTDDSPQKKMFGIETENLYFDTQTGLLIRRSMIYHTPLGPLPEVTDYEDYRKVKGNMMPFTIRLSRPPFVYLQKFNKIELNTALPEKQFDQPATK